MKHMMQNRLVQIIVVAALLVITCFGLLMSVMFFLNTSSQVANKAEQVVRNNSCRNEVQMWINNSQEVMRYQIFSVQAWQNNDADNAISYYEKATTKYIGMPSPSCDADAELAHTYKGEELLLLGKSYHESLVGSATLANKYISDANKLLKKEQQLLENIKNRYQFN
jgi:hypothetical protein